MTTDTAKEFGQLIGGAATPLLGPEPRKQFEDAVLPLLLFPPRPMELFDPERHLAESTVRVWESHSGPSGAAPPLPLHMAARANPGIALIPRLEDCEALWDKYEMMDHIRLHSAKVADLAYSIALLAAEKGYDLNPDAVRASGLLHDLAKTYTIQYGGSHSQLGAAWVTHETRNPEIAQGVLFHVHWPWDETLDDDRLLLVLLIEYADKRVKHQSYVTLEERFDDLQARYGITEYAKARIELSHQQGQRIEESLSRRLEVDLHEYIADSGRLVKRA
jgi:putative nucleotidyltransferase with HDIG domain